MKAGLTSDMIEAAKAAKQLQSYLNEAVNVNTGKLDLSRFMQQLNQGGVTLQQYADKLQAIGPTGEKAFLSVTQAISQAQVPIFRSNQALEKLWVTMKNTMRWRLTTGVLNAFIGGVQKAYGYAKDLDASLNSIRIVTGNSAEQMAEFAKQANKAAAALSSTTTTYTDASLIYYQQGLSDAEVKERTDATIKMANVTGQEAETVASQMTAIWNNFKEGSRTLESYEDAMVALGASTATSSKEIAEGISKFAPVANTVGLSFDYAAAALATITATTRESASIAGNALKTLFSRLEGLKLGETLDDGTDLNKYSKALETVGIDIKDVSGELKNMDTILDELGAKWQLLARDEQMALAETVGGVRQYAQLVALMDNWTFFQENLATARGSEGELDKQAKIYAESWKAARNEVKNASQDIYDSLINADFFIGFDQGLADFLHGVAQGVDAIGGMKGAILLLGSTFLTLFQDKIAKSLTNLAYNFDFITGKAQKAQMVFKESSAIIGAAMVTNSGKSTDVRIRESEILAKDVQMQNILNTYAKQLTEEQYKQLTQIKDTVIMVDKIALGYQKAQEPLDNNVKKLHQMVLESDKVSQTSNKISGSALTHNINNVLAGKFNLKELNVTSVQLENLGSALATFETLSSKSMGLDHLKTQVQGLNSELAQDSSLVAQVKNNFQQLTGLQLQGSSPAEWLKQIEQSINSANSAINFLKAGLRTYVNPSDWEAVSQLIDQLGVAAGASGGNVQSLNGALAASEEELQQFCIALQNTLNQGASFSQQLVTIANGMMRLGMMAQAIKNLGSVWKRDDLTVGEKWIQTLTSIGMIIPSLMTVIKLVTSAQKAYTVELRKGTEEEVKAALAKEAGAKGSVVKVIGIKTENHAVAENTVVVRQNTKAWMGNPIGWIALAITTIVAAYSIWNSRIQEQNKLIKENAERQAETLQKQSDQAKEEIDANKEISQSYEETIASLKENEDSKEKLQEITDKLLDAYDDESIKLDILTGKYKEASQAILKLNKDKLEAGITTSQDTIDTYQQQLFATGTSTTALDSTPRIAFSGGTFKNNNAQQEALANYITKQFLDKYGFDPISYTTMATGQFGGTIDIPVGVSITVENQEEFQEYFNFLRSTIDEYTENYTGDLVALTTGSIYASYSKYLEQLDPIFEKLNQEQARLLEYQKELAGIEGQLNLQKGLYDISNVKEYADAREQLVEIYKEQAFVQSELDKYNEEHPGTELDKEQYATKLADSYLRQYSHLKDFASELTIIEGIEAKIGPNHREMLEGIVEGERYGLETLRRMLGEGLLDSTTSDNIEQEFQDIFDRTRANILLEKLPIELGTLSQTLSDLEQGNKLSEKESAEQLEQLKALEAEYPKLAAIRDRTSTQYIQALRDIREGMENIVSTAAYNQLQELLDDNNIEGAIRRIQDIRKGYEALYHQLWSGGSLQEFLKAKQKIDVRADLTPFLQDLDKILAADYQVQVAIEADLESDFNDAIQHSTKIQEASALISEGFEIAVKDIDTVVSAFPGILAGYTVTADGMIQLNQEIATSVVDLAKVQVESEIEAAKANLIAYQQVLLNKAAAMRTIAEGLQDLKAVEMQAAKEGTDYTLQKEEELAKGREKVANGVLQLTEAMKDQQEIISNDLANSEIDDANDVLLAQNNAATSVSNDWAEAYKSMAKNSSEWARIAIDNARKVQQALQNGERGIPVTQVATSGGIFNAYKGGVEEASESTIAERQGIEQLTWEDYYSRYEASDNREERIAALNASIEAALREATQYEKAASLITTQLAQLDGYNAGLNNLLDFKNDKKSGSTGKTSNEKALEDLKQALERYHEITREIEAQERALSKLEKQISRTYGLDRLKLYEKQLKELEKLADLQTQKANAAFGFIALDLANIESKGLNPDVNNDNFNLNNFTDMLQQSQEDYQKAVDQYNTWLNENWNNAETKEAQEALQGEKEKQKQLVEDAKKLYEERTEALKQYEDSVDTYWQQIEKQEDALRQIEDAKLNSVSYRMEVILDVREARKQIRDFTKEIAQSFGDALTHGAEEAKLGWEQAEDEMAMYKEYVQEYNDLKALLDNANEYTDTTAIIDELKNLEGNIIESGQRLLEWADYVENMFVEALSAASERFKRFTDQIAHDTNILGTIKELYALQGITYKVEGGFAKLMQTVEGQYQGYLRQAQLNKEWYEDRAAQLAQAEAALQGVLETDIRYDTLKKNRDALLAEANEAQQAMLDNAKSAMEVAKQMYLDQVEKMAYELEKKITGGSGFDLLQDKYDHYLEENDRYLDNIEESLETSIWYTRLQQDIDKTGNNAYKERLKRLQEEIDLRREGNTLSKYDLDILEAKYKVLQAQAALEDAQNNKSKVRLVRDSNGNWNYQFTADQGDMESKEEELLKAKQNEYEITKQRYKDLNDEMLRMAQEFAEKDRQIREDMANGILTEEEGQARLAELKRYYEEKANYLSTELNIAKRDMTEAAITSATLSAGLTESVYNSSNELVQTIVNTFKNTHSPQLLSAASTTLSELQIALGAHIGEFSDASDEIKASIAKIIGTETSDGQDINGLVQRLNTSIPEIADKLAGWEDTFSNAVDPITIALQSIIEGGDIEGISANQLPQYLQDIAEGTLYDVLMGDGDNSYSGLAHGVANNFTEQFDSIIGAIEENFIPAIEEHMPEAAKAFEDFTQKIENTVEAIGIEPNNLSDMTNELTEDIQRMYDEGYEAISMMEQQLWAVYDLQAGYLDLAASVWDYIYALQALAANQVVPTIESASGVDTFSENEPLPYVGDLSQKMAAAKYNGDTESYNTFAQQRAEAIETLQSQGIDVLDNSYVEIKLNEADRELLKDFATGQAYIAIQDKDKSEWEQVYDVTGSPTVHIASGATGMYTGDFDGGKLGILHEKELVLNEEDTRNILTAVNTMRGMSNAIFSGIADRLDGDGLAAMAMLGSRVSGIGLPSSTDNSLEQHVIIESVSFPGVTSSREIEEAFENLVNDAAQWARRRKS